MRIIATWIMVILILASFVYAQQGQATLLAVKEENGKLTGSSAMLYLNIEDGAGRVFMETRPLTKLDTQISTRFAKDIACDYLDINCDNKNFLYTIEASGPIIGGPSAGASIAVLTATLLKGTKVNLDVAITGTINSGGSIGPVGGLKEKIDAASEAGIKKVLIPRGSRFVKENSLTLDLRDYANKKGMELVEVGDLTEALYESTGKKFKKELGNLNIDKDYINIMKGLAGDLCERSDELDKELSGLKDYDKSLINEEFVNLKEDAVNLTIKAESAFNKGAYYSAASYCFGANVKFLTSLIILGKRISLGDVEEGLAAVEMEIEKEPIETITDLQAYMVVKERLRDARASLEKIKNDMLDEDYNSELAFLVERLNSAKSWSRFFDNKGKRFEFDRESLKDSCINKISEAEERIAYVKLFLTKKLTAEDELEFAKKDYEDGFYELCLFKASKSKSDADALLSLLGVKEEDIVNLIDSKLSIAKRIIIEAASKGEFPILGYSYYEYAGELKEEDKYSALLYVEDALELSNMDLYFKEYKEYFNIGDYNTLLLFLSGLIIGFGVGILIMSKLRIKKRKNKPKKRK